MFGTIPISVFGAGVIKLNMYLSPLLLMLFLYILTMASRAPGSVGILSSFGMAFLFVFVMPASLVLAHLIGAKIIDGFFMRISFTTTGVTLIGLLISAALIVIAGNIFLDNLYQFRRGNYGISIWFFIFDIVGVVSVILAGGGNLKFWS